MSIPPKLASSPSLREFLCARSGVAAVEFALILPIMLLVYIGGVEVSQGLAADRKLDAIATTLGDLMSRLSGEVEYAAVADYFEAATPLMMPFDADEVEQRITIASISEAGGVEVTDSFSHNGAATLSPGASVEVPSEVVAAASGDFIIITEVWYRYTPVLGYAIGDLDLSKRHYQFPRQAGGIDIVNAGSGGGSAGDSGESGDDPGSGSGDEGSGDTGGDDDSGDDDSGDDAPPPGGNQSLLCRIFPFLCG